MLLAIWIVPSVTLGLANNIVGHLEKLGAMHLPSFVGDIHPGEFMVVPICSSSCYILEMYRCCIVFA